MTRTLVVPAIPDDRTSPVASVRRREHGGHEVVLDPQSRQFGGDNVAGPGPGPRSAPARHPAQVGAGEPGPANLILPAAEPVVLDLHEACWVERAVDGCRDAHLSSEEAPGRVPVRVEAVPGNG